MSQEKIYDDFFGILTNHNKLNELTPLPDNETSSDDEALKSLKAATGSFDQRSKADLNIHESTDYEVLMRIFEDIYINPDDTIVDFGCGMGRVLFYCNNRFFCNVKGIEINPDVYKALFDNAENYHTKFMEQRDKFSILNIHASEYEIAPTDNFFYFFNPFSADVLEGIIKKIMKSVHENLRQITIILYYCTFEMMSVIRKFPHRLEKVIKLPGYDEDPDEKAYIYML